MIIEEGEIVAERSVPSSLPIFKDHFPQNPIYPAFLQLEWVRESLVDMGEVDSFLNVKFLKSIVPNDTIFLMINNVRPFACDFTILVNSEVATKGKIRFISSEHNT